MNSIAQLFVRIWIYSPQMGFCQIILLVALVYVEHVLHIPLILHENHPNIANADFALSQLDCLHYFPDNLFFEVHLFRP